MNLLAIQEEFLALFSRVFPKTVDVEIRVDSTDDGDFVFVDTSLRHQGRVHRVDSLGKIPARVKLGKRYFKVSQRNRKTLRRLAEWDPALDSQKRFIFHEKDVPEVLNFLRTKTAVQFTDRTGTLRVDNRPLEHVHAVTEEGDALRVSTSLSDPDDTVTIEEPNQVQFLPDSRFVHAKEGYFKRPKTKGYKVLDEGVGTQLLRDDDIPLFLLFDLKRVEKTRRSSVAPTVRSQVVVDDQFLPKVSLHVDGPWLWLDVKYKAAQFNVPYATVATVSPDRRFVHQEDGWVRIDRKAHMVVREALSQIPQLEQVADGLRAPAYQYQNVQSLLEAVATIDHTEAYDRFLKTLENFSEIKNVELPHSFTGKLYPYQNHGYDWLWFLKEFGLNGILADEMGLGKTVQAIACLLNAAAYDESLPSLIVCPTSIVNTWKGEFSKFSSPVNYSVGCYVGGARGTLLTNVNRYNALITTYSIVQRDIATLRQFTWEYVILDEAQKIKNYETATAKACKALMAKHKLAVTGTPIENRLSELWSIYDFLMPTYLGSYSQFRDRYEIPIMKVNDRQATKELKRRIAPFKLRRLKRNVLTDLPDKIPMERYCELTVEQVNLYKLYAGQEQERIRRLPGDTARIDTHVLAAITKLKEICCHPALVKGDFDKIANRSGKLNALEEIVEEISNEGEKALIFSQYTRMLGILRKVLDGKNIPYLYLDGSTLIGQRQNVVDRFQAGETPFFLVSLLAGGLGLNLTAASCVVLYDRWWNPAVENQAIDRAHRIGQRNVVKVFRIHAVGTIEERIDQLLLKKKDLFDSVIEADDLKKEISKGELLSLFTPPE